jgi:4-diphosphocytidyl-2-C-methyl-D-erythritol kinase
LPRSNRLQEKSWLVYSPAKINLFLEVTGRRPDGFHELETVMVRTDLCDSLHFTERHDDLIQLTLAGGGHGDAPGNRHAQDSSLDFPLDESNLIVRAARALQMHADGARGVSIRVHKRIPSLAGLGGGSGNAATTLRTLNRLWQLNLPLAILHDIAATLGSDVNFLLSGYRAALCGGRGEQIHPLTVCGWHDGVLVIPKSGNSTAEVFRALEPATDIRSSSALIRTLHGNVSTNVQPHCFNRLQTVAARLNPDVQATLSSLTTHTGHGIMTGSGSACFSLLSSSTAAGRLAGRFGTHGNGRCTAFRF